MDSGKTTVYLPPGDYRLSDTIHIRGSVRRIIGFGARISPVSTSFRRPSRLSGWRAPACRSSSWNGSR